MKKSKALRIGCILLLFILIFSFTACKKENDLQHKEGIRLQIIDKPIKYTSDDLMDANARFTKIGVSLLGERFRQRISDEFDTTVIPMLYRIKIYKNELNAVFDEIEKHLSNEENSDAQPVLLTFYNVCQYILGTKKAGQVFYSISVRILEKRAENALKNHEELGYAFYKETADRCTALKNAITRMGEGKFSDALSITSAVISLSSSLNAEIYESAFRLSDAEILLLFEKTANSFKEKELSEGDWEIFGGWFSEIVGIARLTPSDDDINKTLIYALKNYTSASIYDENDPDTFYKSTYFACAMRIMPKVISLYCELAKSLKEDGTFSLEGTNDQRINSLFYALSRSESSIRELDSALNEYAKIDNDYLKSKITTKSNADEIEAFISSHGAISCDEFIDALLQAVNGDGLNAKEFTDILISYTLGVSPYFAFVLSVNIG